MIYKIQIRRASSKNRYNINNLSRKEYRTELSASQAVSYLNDMDYFRIVACPNGVFADLILSGLDCRKLSLWNDPDLTERYGVLLYLTNSYLKGVYDAANMNKGICVVIPNGEDLSCYGNTELLPIVLYDTLPYRFEVVMNRTIFVAVKSCTDRSFIDAADAESYSRKVLNGALIDPGVKQLFLLYSSVGSFADTKAYLLTLWSLAVNKIAYPLGDNKFIVLCGFDTFESVFKMYFKKYYDACRNTEDYKGFTPCMINTNYNFFTELKEAVTSFGHHTYAEESTYFE